MSHESFAYLSNTQFGGLFNAPHLSLLSAAPFCAAGVAWDGSVTNRPGARFGPGAIRRASHMLCDATHTLWDTTPRGALVDMGDIALPNTSIAAMRASLVPTAKDLLTKYHMLWLGGDHSITLPLLQAYFAVHQTPLALIHFDAHCDTWADHFGEPSGHGTWTYEAIEQGLVDPTKTVQLGIRSAATRDAREYVRDKGGAIYTARDLRGLENASQLAAVISEIRSRIGDTPCYLTIDIDCLDPAFAPGTGTPEPGGMSTNQVLTLLEALHNLNFIGMDCCEVAPPYDHAELTSNAAAILMWTYICGQLQKRVAR
jgi:agmatinase